MVNETSSNDPWRKSKEHIFLHPNGSSKKEIASKVEKNWDSALDISIQLNSTCKAKTIEVAKNDKSTDSEVGLCIVATRQIGELARKIRYEFPEEGKLNFELSPGDAAYCGCTNTKEYANFMLKILAKDPEEKYQTVDRGEFKTDLYETPFEGLMVAVNRFSEEYVTRLYVMDTASALKFASSKLVE